MVAYLSLLSFILLFPAEYVGSQEIRKIKNYNLSAPSSIIILPDILTEISGITSIDSTSFACIQDEVGVVFFYNSMKGQIVNQIQFTGIGDFEGITRVNRSLYILRSDGFLYELTDYHLKSPVINTYRTGIAAKDNEGLCYDSRNKRLLIACKQGYSGDVEKNKQLVYSFDLKTKKLSNEPVIVIDIKSLRKIIRENDIKIPGIDKDDIDKLDFRISDIGIDPVSGKIFIISAADYVMITTDMSGRIETITPLKKDIFRQAEGITFNNRGDLFISNEGAGKSPTLLRFNYIKVSSTATIH